MLMLFMDTKPAASAESPKPTPVMDVVAPPPGDRGGPQSKAVEPDKASKPDPKPKPPRQPGNSVGQAIFATMVIVIVLATLATYAYLKSH